MFDMFLTHFHGKGEKGEESVDAIISLMFQNINSWSKAK